MQQMLNRRRLFHRGDINESLSDEFVDKASNNIGREQGGEILRSNPEGSPSGPENQ
jgi:hypothetical protein